VVDVGANEGNFSNAVLALAPRAQVIAEAGGGRLGRTLRLSTDGSGEVRHFDYLGLVTTSMGAEQAPAAGATVVVAPVITVSATVHGRWEFAEVPR